MDPRYIEAENMSPALRIVIVVIFVFLAIMAFGFLIAMYRSMSRKNLYMSYAPLTASSSRASIKACRAFSNPQVSLRLSTRNDPKINTGISLNGILLVDVIVRDSAEMPKMMYSGETRITELNDMFVSNGPNAWKLNALHMTTLGIDDKVYIPDIDSTNITYTIAHVVDYNNLRRFALENNAIAFRPGRMFQVETNMWLPMAPCS